MVGARIVPEEHRRQVAARGPVRDDGAAPLGREADALEAELELASTTLHKAIDAGIGITEAMNRYEAADKAIIAAREQGNTCL